MNTDVRCRRPARMPLALVGLLVLNLVAWSAPPPVPDKIPLAIVDRQECQWPDRVQLKGWVGLRLQANEANRLVKLDPARLLEGYRKRPGRQTWDGEHVGKWLHASTLAWVNTGDPALRQKIDSVASELLKCQLEDGYLGTYLEKDRWTEWDVWAHKYNLIGLLTYMRYTGNTDPLPACRRMADLLCRTFGDGSGQRDILKAGHHVGLAPTSVLEPMVLLYRLTGEPKYLEFCNYILRAWEQPHGPKVISTLLTQKRVDKVGNGKAYEMLSCLNGALEYYRTVGGPEILQACLNAWQDIVDKRLYLTGAASYGELFHDDFDLPNVNNVGETCVTVTWLQFNAQLLRLTGEARFAEQLERVILNQLFGAQRCDGSGWGYYVQMEGKKPYSSTLDGHCCLSSGPRGVALIPTFAFSTDRDGIVVNLYDTGTARLELPQDGSSVTITIDTLYPADGKALLKVNPAGARAFSVKLRVPDCCPLASLRLNRRPLKAERTADGYVAISRAWQPGDQLELEFQIEPCVLVGEHKNQGKVALMHGPLVLAADGELLSPAGPDAPAVRVNDFAVATSQLSSLDFRAEPASPRLNTWPGARQFRINAVARRSVGSLRRGSPATIGLLPFADAGGTGSEYKVWLPLLTTNAPENLFQDERESRSRAGNLDGSIVDGDLQSVVVTFDGQPRAEDWFTVELEAPVAISRIVYAHGRTFHDGGWFDVAGGRPRVQARVAKDGPWKPIGEFPGYPATTATLPGGLQGGEKFELRLAASVTAWAVRVIGKPACGDNPQQAFASCAELQAFAK